MIYKNFDGVPMIGISTGDRFEHSALNTDDWDFEHAASEEEAEVSDVCTLMSSFNEARLMGSSLDAMFAAAPCLDQFERLLAETAAECAQEDGLSVRGIVKRDVRGDAAVLEFYGRLCRDWHATTIEEGLDVPCPSRRVFVHAVIAELLARSPQVRR
ncbi:hypothetical protein [Rhizobium leguminosarum]|uniref:hypothetical protein n=1 Tax=Rhizobium leguminosarum TaxID=384 RepID=UPI00103E8390|nr:hypothetical protein [Rhizobium leguminosarum]TBY27423.1 hypothetical protein E0H55_27415 [Rhizobium leguminosarum bv. viciae]